MSEDEHVSAEVESAFDPLDYAEVRIVVRLPGTLTDSGEPVIFQYNQLMMPEEVRMSDIYKTLPYVIERAAKGLMMSMRFR